MIATALGTTHIVNRLGNKLLPVFTGKLLPVLFLTIIMVLYSRKLSYYDYGQFQTLWIYSNIISVVISFGLSSLILSTAFNMLTSFLSANKRVIIRLYAAGMLTSFIIFYFTTHYFPSGTKLLLMLFIFLQCGCTLTDTLLIKQSQLTLYVWLNIIYTLLFFSIHLYFYYNNFVLNQLIVAITILSLVKAAGIFLVRLHTLPAIVKAPATLVNNWLFIGINEIVGVIARWLDKLFLLYLLSPAAFAIFFNGAFEIPLFAILISAMENVMLTIISSDVYNKQAALHIFKQSFKILSLIAFPVFFFLLSMHAEAFAIIFNNKYNASIPVFLVSIFIIPVRITHYGVILQCYGEARKIAFGSLLDIVFSLLLMFILYPLLGTPGVALAIVISTYLQAYYYVWQSARLIKVRIGDLVPLFFLLKLWVVLAAFYGLLYYTKDYFSSTVSLLLAFFITGTIMITGLVWYWKSNHPETLISFKE